MRKFVSNKKNPTIIVDGSLYLYTSYYAFRNFNNFSSKPSGAIYGMLKMIDNILQKYQNPIKIVIVFDTIQTTFRKKLFKEYKKNRSPMPNDLCLQIQPLFHILKQIGIKTLIMPGIEADDIIGSLACLLEKKGEQVLIVSHDKDMLQLVTDNIHILHKKNNFIITPDIIKKKYGIQPKEFIDILALVGDVSDNIPGVPTIGIKTALYLINKFSNITNIYNNIENISSLPLRNVKNIIIALKNNKKIAFLGYILSKIKLDVGIDITLKDITLKRYCSNKLFKTFKDYTLQ